MNSVNLIGRLTRDPELRSMPGGDRAVCDLRIAVDNGQNDPTYVDVATFDKQAEACAQYLSQGRQVAVSGRLIYREWDPEDGSKRSKHSVIGRVEFLAKARSSSADNGSDPVSEPEPAAVGAPDEDIPF
jgi:single-strand DNA-binding protein